MNMPLFIIASYIGKDQKRGVKGAEKASCGKTVVQKGAVGESVFLLCPLKIRFSGVSSGQTARGAERKQTLSQNTLLDDHFSAFSARLGRSEELKLLNPLMDCKVTRFLLSCVMCAFRPGLTPLQQPGNLATLH